MNRYIPFALQNADRTWTAEVLLRMEQSNIFRCWWRSDEVTYDTREAALDAATERIPKQKPARIGQHSDKSA